MHCTRNIAFWDKESQLRNNLDSIQKSIGTILTKKSSRTMQKCASPSLLHLHNFIKPDGIDVQRVHLDISSIRGPVSRSRALPRTCPARPRGGTDRVPRERCLEGGGGGARRERWSVARSAFTFVAVVTRQVVSRRSAAGQVRLVLRAVESRTLDLVSRSRGEEGRGGWWDPETRVTGGTGGYRKISRPFSLPSPGAP